MATQAGHESTYSASPGGEDADMFDSSTYECNICYEVAREPVVTMCGHLYCWPCLYRCVKLRSCICLGCICKLAANVFYAWQVDASTESMQGLPCLQSRDRRRQGEPPLTVLAYVLHLALVAVSA